MCTFASEESFWVWFPNALDDIWKEVQFSAIFEMHETEPERTPYPSTNEFSCLAWLVFNQLIGYLTLQVLHEQTVLMKWRNHTEQSHELGVVRQATGRLLSHGCCEQRETNKSKC
jgi:hypothetical protein